MKPHTPTIPEQLELFGAINLKAPIARFSLPKAKKQETRASKEGKKREQGEFLSEFTSRKKGGLTLIEITLTIALTLGLIAVLVLGIDAYKEGARKARCIMHLELSQKCIRSFANLAEKRPGDLLGTGEDTSPYIWTVLDFSGPDFVREVSPDEFELESFFPEQGWGWATIQDPDFGEITGVQITRAPRPGADPKTIESVLVGNELFLPTKPACGAVDYLGWDGIRVPHVGVLALQCNYNPINHAPKNTANW